jgi:hypothetical protein
MNENFGQVPGAYSPEEMMALEGYTPERLESFREKAKTDIEEAHRARLKDKLHSQKPVVLAEEEKKLRNVTVLLGNGKLVTFRKVADLDFGSKNDEGFSTLFFLDADDNVIAQFEPTTWAAYYFTDHCQGIQ